MTGAADPSVLVATVRALLRARGAEDETRALSRQWQATFDAIGDGVFLVGPNGLVARCNRALGELLGQPEAEFVGRSAEGLHAAFPSGPDSPFRSALSGGDRSVREFHSGANWWRLTVDPVRMPGGGAVAILADVTERRRAEEALREADRRKDEFLAMLAHELRNPMAALVSGLNVLDHPDVGPERTRSVREMMHRQAQHLSRLVDDLLDVSRTVHGRVELRSEALCLSAAINRAVETARPAVDARRHTLTVRTDDALWVRGDLVRLAQVFANLIHNAAKYTPPGGRIEVTAAREGNEVIVSVADNGLGLEPDLLPRVLDLFVQAERSLDRAQGGLGIGLTLVRRLVALHDGTVSVRSDGPGRGSTFIVRLPLLVDGTPEAARNDPELSGETTSRRRVLVVEDNADAAEPAGRPMATWRSRKRSRFARRSSFSTSVCRGWTVTRSPGASGTGQTGATRFSWP